MIKSWCDSSEPPGRAEELADEAGGSARRLACTPATFQTSLRDKEESHPELTKLLPTIALRERFQYGPGTHDLHD